MDKCTLLCIIHTKSFVNDLRCDMEHVQPDVFNPNCGSRRVLNLIADRWTALVIYALGRETRRYSDLEKMIGGISQKMLTQTLRNLERDGIVIRTVYPVAPPARRIRIDIAGHHAHRRVRASL